MSNTKTFKIGESSYPPVLKFIKRVYQGDSILTVHGFDYSGKSVSNNAFNSRDYDRIQAYLWTCTTPYYAEKMMEWVKS